MPKKKVLKTEKTTPVKQGKTKSAEPKITKNTLIGDAARMCSLAPEIMMSHGLHCIGCGMTAYETIEQGCMGHGMQEKEVQTLVDELNEAIKKTTK